MWLLPVTSIFQVWYVFVRFKLLTYALGPQMSKISYSMRVSSPRLYLRTRIRDCSLHFCFVPFGWLRGRDVGAVADS